MLPRFFIVAATMRFVLRLMVAGRLLKAAQSTTKLLQFPFVRHLFTLGLLDRVQNFLHLFQGFFQRFDDPPDLFGGGGDG
jgi:hypothetical protein